MCAVRIKTLISFLLITVIRIGGHICLNLALFTPLYFSEAYRAISYFFTKIKCLIKILTICHAQYEGSFKRQHLNEVSVDLRPADLSQGNIPSKPTL
jgi:hypothetical protein